MSSSVVGTEEILSEIKAGRMVILVDEEDRENEGDLLMSGEFVDAESVNFMAKYGRGLICLTLTEDRCRQLGLVRMVGANRSRLGTNFTVSIEAAEGVTTGISAADRAKTIQATVNVNAVPEDIVQPGHIFPLMAQRGGVLVRAGHTEAGCDLTQLAGLSPTAVICEILKDDGSMARLPDLIGFAKEHKLKIGTIADLIEYRSRTESLVEKCFSRSIETAYGVFEMVGYRDKIFQEAHIALIKGEVNGNKDILVRVHEPLSVADFLDNTNTGHSWNIDEAMKKIASADEGVMILLHRAESGKDLLQRLSREGVSGPSEKHALRTYGIGAQILRDLGVKKMRLMANPRPMPSMAGFDLEVSEYLEPIA